MICVPWTWSCRQAVPSFSTLKEKTVPEAERRCQSDVHVVLRVWGGHRECGNIPVTALQRPLVLNPTKG